MNDCIMRFEELFQLALAGERLDGHEKDLSVLFEIMSARLLGAFPSRRGQYFDGVVGLVAKKRKSRQVLFQGEMWVGEAGNQWREPFEAIVTDKRITQQGLWIVISIGDDRAEGDSLMALDDKTPSVSQGHQNA